MNYKPFAGAEELVRDHQRSDGIVTRPTASIADHMGIAFDKTGVLRRIEAGIHTGQDREMATRRQRQIALVSEILGVLRVRSQHFIQNLGHCLYLLFQGLRAGGYQETKCGAETPSPCRSSSAAEPSYERHGSAL